MQAASSFGSGFDVQDFYRPFALDEITPANQQTWPYYKHVSVHWDKYALHETGKIQRSSKPARLTIAEEEKALDLKTEWKEGGAIANAHKGLQPNKVKGEIVSLQETGDERA